MTLRALLLITALAAPCVAGAKETPPGVEAMIRAAGKSDAAVLNTVATVAMEANPESRAEVEALVASLRSTIPPPPSVLAMALPPPLVTPPLSRKKPKAWKGAVELGANQLDGVNEVLGAYGSVDVVRAEGAWSHRLIAKGDYQETNGRQTTDRYSVGYEPKLNFAPSRYAFGLVQFEHDGPLGLDKRYTVGGGIGVGSVEGAPFRLVMDVGPALRITESKGEVQESFSARGSLNVRWVLSERLSLSQENSVLSDNATTTAKSQTAVDSQLYGPLKARVSYNIQYERKPATGSPDTSTAARASLLYAF